MDIPHTERHWYPLIWSVSGTVLMGLLLLRCTALDQGVLSAKWAVGGLLLLLFCLAAVLLKRTGLRGERLLPFLFPLALALFLRVFLLDHQTLDYQDFLAHWAAYFRDNGGFAALKNPVGNYNVPYLYFMALISYIKVPDLYLIKLFSIAFDVLLAWGGFRLVRLLSPKESLRPAIAFCALLLLPTVVLNGASWGQCDSIYTALLLHALACGLERRPSASVLLLAAAFSFKLQAIFLIPLWCVFWFTGRVTFRHLLLFPAGCLAAIAPALLLGKPLGDIISIYLGQMGVDSALSFNAPSIYQFLPYGAEVNRSLLAKLGILTAFLLVLGLLAFFFRHRARVNDSFLLTAALVLAVGVPFLLPYMHERYFFPADVLALIWACIQLRRLPQAIAIQLSSVMGYLVYFTMHFQGMVKVGGLCFPMGIETALVLFVLLSAIAALRPLAQTAGTEGA